MKGANIPMQQSVPPMPPVKLYKGMDKLLEPVPERFKRAVIKEPADPIVKKGKYPTLVNNLGYLNTVYCPRCGRRIFGYYDKDILPDGPDAFRCSLSHTVNYCAQCGLHLNLDRWKDPNNIDVDHNNLFYVPESVSDEDVEFEGEDNE